MHITQTDGGSRSKEWRSRNLCFALFSLRLCQRFREKPAIVSVHRTSRDCNCSLAHHAYFAEQLSLLQCAVRYMRVRTRWRMQGVGERHWRTPSSAARMVKFHAVPSDAQENILRSVRHRHSHLTTPVFVYATASALLTKCKSFPTPRFRQTCGRKYRTPCRGRSAKRGLLNNSQ